MERRTHMIFVKGVPTMVEDILEGDHVVNGVQVSGWYGYACVTLDHGRIGPDRKPGIWQTAIDRASSRLMVHYTCPWCGKIGSDMAWEQRICTICEGCWRHYYVKLEGWHGLREEEFLAKKEARRPNSTKQGGKNEAHR